MLTFNLTNDGTIRITGADKAINVFPKKSVTGDINLVAKPEEEFNAEVVCWPGEYDIAGVTIRGIGHLDGQQVSFVIEADGYRIAIPSMPLVEWSDADLEHLGEAQVLLLPAEDAKKALKLVEDLDPRVLFLVAGADGKMDQEVIKQCGAAGREHVKEHKLKGSLAAEGREVVVLG